MSNKLIYRDPAIKKIIASKKTESNEPDEYTAGFNNGLMVAVAVLHLEPAAMDQKWIRTDEQLPMPERDIEMFFPHSNSVCIGFYLAQSGLRMWCCKTEDGKGVPCAYMPAYWRYRDPILKPKLN